MVIAFDIQNYPLFYKPYWFHLNPGMKGDECLRHYGYTSTTFSRVNDRWDWYMDEKEFYIFDLLWRDL